MKENTTHIPLEELSRLGEVREGKKKRIAPFRCEGPFELSRRHFYTDRTAKKLVKEVRNA